MKKLFIFLRITLLVVVLQSCNGKNEKKSKEPVRLVKSELVSAGSQNQNLEYFGSIAEDKLSMVSFRTGGRLDQLETAEGAFIAEGALIARIDNRDHETALKAAKAQYEQAKSEYERYKQLFERDKLPENTLEKFKSGYLLAESNWEKARNALADCRLVAPFSGYVYEVYAENHEAVAPGQPIISLLDVSSLEMIFHIPEEHLVLMDKIQKISLDINAAALKGVPAKLKSTGKKTGTNALYEVRLQLDNQGNKIKPGMSATANIVFGGKMQDWPLVPAEALFYENSQAFVWIIDAQNTTHKKEVIIDGLSKTGRVHIKKGLSGGERIVTAGTHFIHEGQKVRLMQQKQTAPN